MSLIRATDREPILARDGSSVREIAGPPSETAENQSLAEATVEPGGDTVEHFHRTSEEIYVFRSGSGRVLLGEEVVDVRAGDVVPIPPGTRHKVWSDPNEPLVFYCCCSPPYSDDDTVLSD